MRSLLSVLALLIVLTFSPRAAQTPAPSFAVEQILGFPSPENRVASPVVSAAGGSPKVIADGDTPVIAPDGDRIAFVRDRRIWFVPIDGSKQPQQAFYARGSSESPAWSPDGRTLAFVSNRGDHSFIGLFSGTDRPIRFIAPSTSRDSLPAWSADGRKIAFLRQPEIGRAHV